METEWSGMKGTLKWKCEQIYGVLIPK